MEAGCLASDLSGSLQKLNRLYVKAEVTEQAKYGLHRAAVTKLQKLAHSSIYEDAHNYKRLKEAVEDFWSDQIALRRQKNTGNKEGFAKETLDNTWNQPRKVLRRLDSYSSPLETEVDALAEQLTKLLLTIKKNQMESR